MNKKIFSAFLILIFIGGIMQIGDVYGQSWPQKPDGRLVAQGKLIAQLGGCGGRPNLDNLEKFSDIRFINLQNHRLLDQFQKIDLRNKYDILITCIFDSQTPWPPKEKLPPNFDPQEIIDAGKDPGLGIRNLQKQGVNGKGVDVAIIDQILPWGGDDRHNHEEYNGKISQYTGINAPERGSDEWKEGEMHGAAVTSLFAGDKCGTSPGAHVHYWGLGHMSKGKRLTRDEFLDSYAEALYQIIAYNKAQKNPKDKIKIVSASIWLEGAKCERALQDAKKSGLIVIHSGSYYWTVGCPLDTDKNDPQNYDICYWSMKKKKGLKDGYVYVPVDNRSMATVDYKNNSSNKVYEFGASGSHSWASPYLSGVMALGFQIDPDLKEDDIWKYLRETGTPFNKGWIINPKAFVDRVKAEKEKHNR